jgi:hypothetical protein
MALITRALYAIFGILSLVSGLVAAVKPSLIFPPEESAGYAGHLIREQGALFVFAGLMFFWCLRHFESRRPVHLAFIVFLAIYSGIHWAGYFDTGERLFGAIATSIPALALLATVPRR